MPVPVGSWLGGGERHRIRPDPSAAAASDAGSERGGGGRRRLGLDPGAGRCIDEKRSLLVNGSTLLQYAYHCKSLPWGYRPIHVQLHYTSTPCPCISELCQVVGDDLLMSDPERIKRAVNDYTCDALALKANQVGTVTEAIEVVKQAKDAH